jgi:hypothetical protein
MTGRRVAILLAAIGLALAWSAPSAHAAAGYRDFSFGSTAPAPTAKDPQSKLWFNDGIWWGSLYNASTGSYHIYRLAWSTQTWSDSGVVVDERDTSRSDVLWDGSKLYVVSAGTNENNASHGPRLMRYSYASGTKTYTLDSGFPVTLSNSGSQAVTIAKDTTGKLWIAYTKNFRTYVAYSTTDDRTWATPFLLPVPGNTSAGANGLEEAGIVAYEGKIGVMFSNQNDWAFYLANHTDGDSASAWSQTTVYQANEGADNHLHIKALTGDPAGRLFALGKTSLNEPTDPLYNLFVLGAGGTWSRHPVATVADNWTRAQLVIDPEQRDLYVFGASPCCNGGTIYYKKRSLDDLAFGSGKGTALIESPTDTNINDPTSTKQNVSSSTGLLVVAGDVKSKFYLHNGLDLGAADTSPPDTMITSGPSGVVNTSEATFTFSSTESGSTFACKVDGGAFVACTSPKTYLGFADGSHTFQVRATDAAGNVDPTPATRTWTIDTSTTAIISPAADARVEQGNPATNFGLDPTLVADSSPLTESYLRFSVSGISGSIVSAKLRLFATNGTTNGPELHTAPNTWDETSITWNTRPAPDAATIDDKGSIPVNTWAEYDATPVITGNGTYTFNLHPTSSDGVDFVSHDGVPENRPQLVLTLGSDTLPPQTTIDSGPTGSVSTTSATFSFSSSEANSTFECKLDGAAFAGCSSPTSYTGLAEGSHTFEVRATDAAGNTDPTPATRAWSVDTTAPIVTSTLPPDGTGDVSLAAVVQAAFSEDVDPATLSSATFTIVPAGGGGPVAATVAYDGASRTATLDPDESLAAGTTYTASVAGGPGGVKDVAGNALAADVSWSFTTATPSDVTPPETTIDSGPSGTVATTSATFTFSSGEAGSSFACSLDGAGFVACASPVTYSALAEGSHTFQVRATDAAGNVDPTPAARTWTVSLSLFADGFESGDFSAWTRVTTGGDGTATVQSSLIKAGTFAAQLAETANTGSLAYVRKTLSSSQTDLTASGDFRITQEGASGGNVPILRLFDSSGTRLISLYRQNLDGNKIRVTHSGVGFTTSGTLALNTWGRFDLHVITAGTGVSTVEVFLNGTVVYRTNTASLGTSGVATVQIGNDTAKQTFTIVADDISVRAG